MINKRLRDVSPRLLYDDAKNLRIVNVPGTLLTAMWTQLAESIVDRAAYRQCPVCSKFFRGGRTDKTYCSTRCRVEKHRAQEASK